MRRKWIGLRPEWWGLLALLAVGFGLRMWGIERYGLWFDEITTAQCLGFPLFEIGNCHWVKVGSPVLFVATNLVYAMFGSPPLPVPEWMVRLPEVIAGTLAIGAAWLAARELLGRRAAWLNALLWTFAPVAVAYSQEARMYAWLMLFSNLSAWLLLRTLRRGSWRGGIVYGIVAGLNFYSHYLGAFVIAGQLLFAGAYVLFCRWHAPAQMRRVVLAGIGFVVVPAVFVVLWLPNIGKMSEAFLSPGATTRMPLSLQTLADAQTWMALDRVDLALAALFIIGLEVLGAWWMMRHARGALGLTACWLAPPFVFLLIQQGSWTAMRYWIVILPPVFWLLTASALALIEALEKFLARRQVQMHRAGATIAFAVCGVLLLLPVLGQFYTDQFESSRFDDWRGAAQFLGGRMGKDDMVLAFGDFATFHVMGLDYYLGSPRLLEVHFVTGDAVARAEKTRGRVWAITYARDEQARARLRALIQPPDEIVWFKNLALLVPAPRPQETLRANVTRLLSQLRPLDEADLGQALALFDDMRQGEDVLANPQLDVAADGSPMAWQVQGERGQVVVQAGQRALQLTHQAGTAPVTATQTVTLVSDQTYVLHFECLRALAGGTPRTFIIFDGADGKQIVLPKEGGYICPRGRDWHAASFAFRVPSAERAAPVAHIVLQNQGVGDALWRNLRLNTPIAP